MMDEYSVCIALALLGLHAFAHLLGLIQHFVDANLADMTFSFVFFNEMQSF